MKEQLTHEQIQKEISKAKRANYIVFGIMLFCLLFLISAIFIYKFQHSFSTKKWTTAPEHRARIVSDMIEKHELIGMKESEIIALLGQNDNNTGYFSADNRFVYCLGMDGQLFKIDSQWLLINFSDGMVSEYSFTTD